MQQEQITLDSWSGKTCLEPSQAQTEKVSEPSSKKRRVLPTQQYQFLELRSNGLMPGAYWVTDLAYHGARLTRNTGEYPNVVVESTLSQILEDNPHPKYFLSNRAVIGILRRANNRGKELPQMLKSALINQARECNYGNALYEPLIEQSEVCPTVISRGPCAVYSMQRSDEYVAADVTSTESARQYKSATDLVTHTNAVRRLTPLECERLQGYPDNYTNIPGASDSARYKALGNSFAIPNALFVIDGCVEKLKEGI